MLRVFITLTLITAIVFGQTPLEIEPMRARRGPQIEPEAGKWQTWVISSGRDYRVPPPPSRKESREELKQLAEIIRQNNEQTKEQIAYWDAGAPAYRWIDMLNARMAAGVPTTAYPHRVYTYVALAMYDATIAAWDSKYHYNRPRPSELDRDLPTSLPVPNSPSYPSEHAATAQAAAMVLAHFLPSEAQKFQAMAEEAGLSRVRAGLQYPSDHQAGLELGKKVAEQVIAKANMDGSNVPWTGTVPVGPCNWVGTNPGNVTGQNWRPLLLNSPGQFRSLAPPPCNSPEVQAEAAAVRNFQRTFLTNSKAYYWQTPDGLMEWPFRYANKWIAEDRLDQNAPRVARIYALLAAVYFDAFIASQDGKFAYWYIRPHQLDTGITPLFPVPNFPSYPSNHSTFSAARAEMLAYLFPSRAEFIRAFGKEAGDSRIWAGIHFEMDNKAGKELGKSVADHFITRARQDGSQ